MRCGAESERGGAGIKRESAKERGHRGEVAEPVGLNGLFPEYFFRLQDGFRSKNLTRQFPPRNGHAGGGSNLVHDHPCTPPLRNPTSHPNPRTPPPAPRPALPAPCGDNRFPCFRTTGLMADRCLRTALVTLQAAQKFSAQDAKEITVPCRSRKGGCLLHANRIPDVANSSQLKNRGISDDFSLNFYPLFIIPLCTKLRSI